MLRKQSDETNPADGFYLAADRLRAADLLWTHQGLTASGIELLQEAVERLLKGFLIARGWRLVKTHDLVPLVSEAAVRDPRFSQFRDLAKELTEDFFAQHYPGEDWTNIGENYAGLRRQTDQMLTLIRQIVPEYFLSPAAGS